MSTALFWRPGWRSVFLISLHLVFTPFFSPSSASYLMGFLFGAKCIDDVFFQGAVTSPVTSLPPVRGDYWSPRIVPTADITKNLWRRIAPTSRDHMKTITSTRSCPDLFPSPPARRFLSLSLIGAITDCPARHGKAHPCVHLESNLPLFPSRFTFRRPT